MDDTSYFPMAYCYLRNESIGNENIKYHISLPSTWSLNGTYRLFHRYTMISNTNVNEVKHS